MLVIHRKYLYFSYDILSNAHVQMSVVYAKTDFVTEKYKTYIKKLY